MPIHAANAESSERLQRILKVLRAGGDWTTLELQNQAHCCAVGTCVSELRAQGFDIRVTQRVVRGSRRWFYRLHAEPAKEVA